MSALQRSFGAFRRVRSPPLTVPSGSEGAPDDRATLHVLAASDSYCFAEGCASAFGGAVRARTDARRINHTTCRHRTARYRPLAQQLAGQRAPPATATAHGAS